ncbi:sigma-70 family RNA polymerase sigma factor [Streptomyces sp. NRRL S-337]|uniref:sigma-70 family RNA polymerase sigma factor n=1 Tax=Streptomyces sp. NRRL S-337 TaxID=1463900 RepID=UPI00131B929B|nr:sigma-70 family RNA polymerase sigma factor [Streptomyces sp. NRRL S-337]
MPGIVAKRSTEQGTTLRAARVARGWSVAQLVMRMRQVAFAQGIELASKANAVETCVRNWERGKYVPNAVYQGILIEVYQMTREELGLPEERVAQAIDAERWGRIFEKYHVWTLRRIRFSVQDHALAEDLASEVFERIGKNLHNLQTEDDALHGYLAVQVRWVIADHLRSKRVQRELLALPADEDMPRHDPVATDALSQPETFVLDRADLEGMLGLLPDQQRSVVALRVFHGLNMNQIAVQLGMSQSTVWRRYTEGIATLRRHLEGGQAPEPVTAEREWTVQARAALLAAASSGRRFTIRDLIYQYGAPEPDTYFQWRPLFEELKDDGVIQRAGYAHGKRQAWIGIAEEPAAMAVAA